MKMSEQIEVWKWTSSGMVADPEYINYSKKGFVRLSTVNVLTDELTSERKLRREHAARIHVLSDMEKQATESLWEVEAERDALKAEVERLHIALRQEEQEHGETVNQRDQAEGYADSLAGSIGEYFRVEIGEHSSMNSPWVEAEKVMNGEYATDSDCERERDTLQSELTKARELLEDCLGPVKDAENNADDAANERLYHNLGNAIRSALAHQSAPTANGDE
jgi:hypothetical protein